MSCVWGLSEYEGRMSNNGSFVFSVNMYGEEAGTVRAVSALSDNFQTMYEMSSYNNTDQNQQTSHFEALLVILAHAILTVEVEGVYSSRGAKQVVKLGFHGPLC